MNKNKELGKFDAEDLLRASVEVLGKGTFGTAYKAVLEMGFSVAVKRLKDVTMGDKEFREKIEGVGAMDHENLVPLSAYYYYCNGGEKLLVYDYMPMGSLSALLHGNRGAGRTPLNWETRSAIALGAARGITSPPTVIHQQPNISHIPEPTLQHHHLAATRIQVRRNTRNFTGLVRLQRVVTSKYVKRQTTNAMKQMQLLFSVQTQIQSRRIQMLENQALKPQPNQNISHKQQDERWDDSLITKEEREARLQRKADAAIKRERAMAYAYSHQLWKDTPTSAHKMGSFPWWWKWVEHQLPYHTPKNQDFASTPSRSTHKQLDTPPTTPMSSRSTNRWMKARKGASLYSMKDDDSLRSCPPFSVPTYMSPTALARAKARPTSNPKERCVTPTTPGSVSSKRRFSSPRREIRIHPHPMLAM